MALDMKVKSWKWTLKGEGVWVIQREIGKVWSEESDMKQ